MVVCDSPVQRASSLPAKIHADRMHAAACLKDCEPERFSARANQPDRNPPAAKPASRRPPDHVPKARMVGRVSAVSSGLQESRTQSNRPPCKACTSGPASNSSTGVSRTSALADSTLPFSH